MSEGWTAADLLDATGEHPPPISPSPSSSSLSDDASSGSIRSGHGGAPSTPPTSPPASTKPSPEHPHHAAHRFAPAAAPAVHSTSASPPAAVHHPPSVSCVQGAGSSPGETQAQHDDHAQPTLSLSLEATAKSLKGYINGTLSCLLCFATVESSSTLTIPDERLVVKMAETPSGRESLRREYTVYSKVHSQEGWSDRCLGLFSSHDGTFDLLVLRDLGQSPQSLQPYLENLRAEVAILHAANILHNDIAARNICIGPDGRARLIDFGASRLDHSNCDGRCKDWTDLGN